MRVGAALEARYGDLGGLREAGAEKGIEIH